MAKKGGAVALQIEVDNDNDWEKLVQKEGLIVADVYSEWSGPCVGMVGALRKVKLELGGDVLSYALAKCDNITCLSRFRYKSRPTWMFIANRRMIRLLFGANSPVLVRILIEEIAKTQKSMIQRIPREGIDFEKLTEEEQEIADEETRIKEEKEQAEIEAKALAVIERREAVAENLIDPLKDYNFVVFWPHITNDGICTVVNAVKESGLSVSGKSTKHLLTDDNIFEMFYYSTWELSDIELEELQGEEITAMLFQGLPNDNAEVTPVDIFLELFYGASKSPPGDEDCLASKLTTTIKIKVEPEEDEGEGEGEDDFSRMSLVKTSKTQKISIQEGNTSRTSRKLTETPGIQEYNENIVTVVIPGIYVPENDKCKVLAMRILFPIVTLKVDLPALVPIPPHVIVAYDTAKRNDVIQLARDWPEETMRFGFFTSADPDTAELICKTVEQFEKLTYKPFDAKLIVQVSKKKSEPLLSYSVLQPMYVSPNCLVGEKECEKLFAEDYDVPEEVEPEEEPHKKASTTSELEEAGEETHVEEGPMEEDEMEGDDDDILGGYQPMD